jgi:hypothetical protein
MNQQICPECGSADIRYITIDSVPGYGAGLTLLECNDCLERWPDE